MKFTVNKWHCYIAIAAFTVSGLSLRAENCECANPPGGEVRCPKGYAAYCVVRDGKTFTGCEETPSELSYAELPKWVISKALAKADIASTALDLSTLTFEKETGIGEVGDTFGRFKITFKLPRRQSFIND
jgi:hypothetical protein